MKKNVFPRSMVILILLLLLLGLGGCAGDPTVSISGTTTDESLTPGKDDGELIMTDFPYSLELLEAAYVRGGSYADTNWHEIDDSDIIVKHNSTKQDVVRYALFKYDISELSEKDIGAAELTITTSHMEPSADVPFDIYIVDNGWSEQTVTFNSCPDKHDESPIIKGMLFNKISKGNLTKLLKELVSVNATEFSIMIVQTMETNAETRITDGYPKLTVYRDESGAEYGYERQLLESEKKNNAIWAQAASLFDEWYAKYEALLAEPQPKAEKIVSDESVYTKKVQTFGHTVGNYDTRTLSALTDFTSTEVKFDQYGGLMDESLKQEATGFFYTEKIGDRWWLIDPLGYPCYIKGMSCIDYAYQGSKAQEAAMLEKYGSASKWAEQTADHLKNDLYFNIEANSSIHRSTSGNAPFPRQIPLSFASEYGKYLGVDAYTGGSTAFSENNTMPVFDPGFEMYANQTAQRVRSNGYGNDPMVLGYTTDNELPLKIDIIYDYLTLDYRKEVNHYSYACAWHFLTEMTGKQNPTTEDVTEEIEQLFLAFLYDRYFDVVTTSLRRADPNHMIMGSRFLTACKDATWLFRFVSPYLDCITINWYYDWEIDEDVLYNYATNATVPFIVTEFYAMGQENEGNLSNSSGAGFTVKTQEERGYFYQNFTLRLLESKNCIGWYWFQYIDNDPKNNSGDSTSVDSNKGIVSNGHNEYTELTSAMVEINRNVYGLISYFDEK